MKYSDQQRIQKIYGYAVKLHEYIEEHQIKKENLLTETPMQIILENMFITFLINIRKLTVKYSGR